VYQAFSVQIGITIVDDNQWEPDEEFFLKLTTLQQEDGGAVKLGRTSIMEITILNDDGKRHHPPWPMNPCRCSKHWCSLEHGA
jgi:hypothetical protein